MPFSADTRISDLDSQQIRELQNLLLRAGYNPGPIDGVMGPATQAAYTRFIRAQGYDPRGTGVIVVPMAQMSNNAPGVWETIKQGGEVGSAPATVEVSNMPAQEPAQASPIRDEGWSNAGVPASTTAPAGGGPAVTASDGATEAMVRQKYPHLAYLLDIPDVKDVLLRATQGGWDQATLQGELWKTTWWQTTSNQTRLWDQKFAQDNATAMLEWDQRSTTIANLTAQMGFTLPDNDVKWLAGRVLREGWSDDQLKRFLGKMARESGLGPGTVSNQSASIKGLAKQYMSTMTDKQATEYAIRIAEGSMTRDAVESMLRDEAKGRFGWLSSQIDAGLTPMDLFAGTRNAVGNMLEIDPSTIDMSDPKWSVLSTPVKEDDGSLRSMNFYEAQQWARQQSSWRYTDNANKAASDVGLGLLQALGVRK